MRNDEDGHSPNAPYRMPVLWLHLTSLCLLTTANDMFRKLQFKIKIYFWKFLK